MQLRFTYTLDELAEAIAPPGITSRTLRSPLAMLLRDVALWAAVIFLSVVLYYLMRPAGPRPEQPPTDVMLVIGGAWMPALLALAFLINVVGQTARGDWHTRRRRIATARRVTSVVILLGMLLAVGALLKNRPVICHASRGEALVLTLMPGVLSLVFLIFAGRLLPRNQLMRQWESGIFSIPKTVELTSDLVSFCDENGDLHCRWSFFQHAKETTNLLLLIARDERIYIIPKRSFASGSEFVAAKAIIQNNFPQSEFLATDSAFPIVPGGRPA